MSLRSFLTRLILLCVVPLVLLAIFLATANVKSKQAERDIEATNLVKSFAAVIDQHLQARISSLSMLAASPLVDDAAHWKDLYGEAQGFHQSFGSHVILADTQRQMLFNTRAPFGAKLPLLPPSKGNAAAPAALATGRPAVGDIVFGPVAREPLVAIAVPVQRKGKTAYLLLTTFETRQFQKSLEQVALPPGWSLALLDSRRDAIASRTTSALNSAPDIENARHFVVKSAVSDWSVDLTIPRHIYNKSMIETTIALAIAILIVILASLLGGVLVSRRLGKAVASLTDTPAQGATPPEITEIAAVRRLLEDSAEKRKHYEETLRTSEDKYKTVADFTYDWETWVDAENKFVYVSPSCERITGYPVKDFMENSQLVTEITHPDDKPLAVKHFNENRYDQNPCHLDFRIITRSGEERWISHFSRPIYDRAGKFIGRRGSNRDITERKNVEEKFHEINARLNLATASAKAGVWDWNLLTDEMIWDDRMLELYGVRQENFTGGIKDWKRHLHPDDLARVIGEYQAALRGEHDFDTEFRALHPDGKVVHIKANGVVLRDKEGKPLRMIGMNTDITERKKAEEALRESERIFSAAFNTNPIPTAISTIQDSRLLNVNDTFLEVFSFSSRAEIIGKAIPELGIFADPADREAIRNYIKEKGSIHNRDIKMETKDGRMLEMLLSADRVLISGKQCLLSTLVDITERRRATAEKKALEERLQRAEKMEALGLLAGGVAHDLNNVTGIIVGYAELLAKRLNESDPVKKDLLNIMDAGQRAAAIVDDLLTLARRGVMGRKVVNINRLILDFQKSPEWEKLHADHPFVQLTTELEPELLNVSASPVHLQKTLFNLVSNASEAMPKGGLLTIKTINQYLDKPVHGHDTIHEGDYVVLSVSDAGEGIPEQNRKRIFEPFYTRKSMGKSGTGLGLAVVWGTVKDHRGYIDVQSKEGLGTVFILYFPVAREAVTTEAAPAAMDEYMGRGESILVVDDVQGQRNLAMLMLKKLNYKVVSAASGEYAVEYLRDHKVDLLVLDMIMDPGLDGLDTYKKVLEIHPGQKAVIVSGFSESERVHDTQALGAGEYVKKPYIQERLGMAVKKELERKQAPADSPVN